MLNRSIIVEFPGMPRGLTLLIKQFPLLLATLGCVRVVACWQYSVNYLAEATEVKNKKCDTCYKADHGKKSLAWKNCIHTLALPSL